MNFYTAISVSIGDFLIFVAVFLSGFFWNVWELVDEVLQKKSPLHGDFEFVCGLARAWLVSKVQLVNQFNKLYPQVVKGKKGFQPLPDSYRSIAKQS